MEKKLTHINKQGKPAMVDVSDKIVTLRTAKAESIVHFGKEIMKLLDNGEIVSPKGPVFQTGIIAGTQAVKRTHELIPFCHPLPVTGIQIEIEPVSEEEVRVSCTVKVEAKTGVEMEALMGASMTALTLYDMCKGLSHNIIISRIGLVEKTGGKRNFHR
ncbi:MAG TPA: cyclic pyranopterin monophosphate synthase MoaC [Cyclobacteriaceae bacterium]|jgi:cyclic pyranopterin phosphate synthase